MIKNLIHVGKGRFCDNGFLARSMILKMRQRKC